MNTPAPKRTQAFQPRHLLGIEGMSAADIESILTAARALKYKKVYTDKNKKSEGWIERQPGRQVLFNPKLKEFGKLIKESTGKVVIPYEQGKFDSISIEALKVASLPITPN